MKTAFNTNFEKSSFFNISVSKMKKPAQMVAVHVAGNTTTDYFVAKKV